jgi:hypothetical protein
VLGDLFRKLVVARLIAGTSAAKGSLRRSIRLLPDRVAVVDTLLLPAGAERATLQLCRRMTSAHMASARYFQPIELAATRFPWVHEIPGSGRERRFNFEVKTAVED